MYPPFEVNNLLGPLLVLACFGKALLLYFALKAMEYYFQEEEATWRKD